MIYRRLDPTYDYSFGQSKQDFLTGVDAVAQAIKTRLFLLFGEWWEDTSDGLPLWQSILAAPGAPKNKRIADSLIKARIIGTPNVTGIINFSSTFDSNTRAYSFQATVNTLFGKVQIAPSQGTIQEVS